MSSKESSKQWHGGKGSQRRGDGEEAYRSNWDRIFGGIDYDTFWSHDCHGKSMMLIKGKACKACGVGE